MIYFPKSILLTAAAIAGLSGPGATAKFDMAGRLDADTRRAADDACVASCVDWYGNARPIFIGNRVFALMGYELVEGRLAEGRMGEVARVNFAPPGRVRSRG